MTDYHESIILRLADAGRTIMMLPMPKNGMPSGAQAAWPDIVQSYWDIVGPSPDEASTYEERQAALERLRNVTRLQASIVGINNLDEVLGWLWLIEVAHERKVVVARMLTRPNGEPRPVYSWRRIAYALGTNDRTIRRWHERGVQAIVVGLAARGDNLLAG